MKQVAVTLPEQIAELQREIRLRELLYPKWIAAGKLKQDFADRQIGRLRATLQLLTELDESRTEVPQQLFRLRTVDGSPSPS